MKSNPVFLLLGSNLGDRISNLEIARERIVVAIGHIIKCSSVYSTAPWGIANQPDFYNQVIQLSTALNPNEVLKSALAIEEEMGRIRIVKWGPRLIDIDLLFYNQEIIESAELTLPHPGIPNRNFTLYPLVEIAPDFYHPVLNKPLTTILQECDDTSTVEKLNL